MWIVGGAIYPFLSEVTSSVDLLNIIFIRSVGAALILFETIVGLGLKLPIPSGLVDGIGGGKKGNLRLQKAPLFF